MTETMPHREAATMKAIVQHKYGPPEVLQLADVGRPTPDDDEVLVQVRAASVGAWDQHDMRGDPFVMRVLGRSIRRPRKLVRGLDLAGQVAAVGANVSRFELGDAVYGEADGAFADYSVAKEDHLALAPSGLSFVEAAAVPVAGATALLGLRDQAELQAGETVLIVGAAGGVGSFAVQIAKAMGAEVTGVCSASSVELVRSLGADHVIDYTEEDFLHRGEHYDVIFQIAGTASARSCRRALKPAGRLVLCSGDGGGRIFGPITRIAGAMLTAPFGGQKTRVYVAAVNTEVLNTLTDLIERGDVSPVIDTTYPLSEAVDAMHRFEDGHGPGKIVLTT